MQTALYLMAKCAMRQYVCLAIASYVAFPTQSCVMIYRCLVTIAIVAPHTVMPRAHHGIAVITTTLAI